MFFKREVYSMKFEIVVFFGFLLLIVIISLPALAMPGFSESTVSKTGYQGCLVGSNPQYVLDDQKNKTSISFSIMNGVISDFCYSCEDLVNRGNESEIEAYIDVIYEVNPEYNAVPDYKDLIVKKLLSLTNWTPFSDDRKKPAIFDIENITPRDIFNETSFEDRFKSHMNLRNSIKN